MSRFLNLTGRVALVVTLAAVVPASAQESKPADSPAEQLKKNPNDVEAIKSYINERVQAIMSAARKAPDEADKALVDLKKMLESVKPTEEQAKALMQQVNGVVGFLQNQIDLARVKLEELQAKLEANPSDGETLGKYASKVTSELQALMDEAPAKAKEQIAAANAFLDRVASKAGDAAKPRIEQAKRTLAQLGQMVESELARSEIIGKDAPPITAEAWVNGKALTEADLKGKVVLLDFWAVWCGPCIATFPHLIEWNEKYADKGLVIIGLTRYYNFKWDEATGNASRAQGEVPHEEEQAMLVKFAEKHGLKHVFAVQTDTELTDFYGVTGIPQAVLIDRAGKIQMIKVGSGEENAKALSAKIEELINAKESAGE